MIFFIIIVNFVFFCKLVMIRKKEQSFKNAFHNILVKTIRSGIHYNPVKLPQMIKALYGDGENKVGIENEKYRVACQYFCIWLVFSISIAIAQIANQADIKMPLEIERPSFGSDGKIMMANIEISNDQMKFNKNVKLTIREKDLTESERSELLMRFAEKLPSLILGKNPDLKHVSQKLNLPDFDDETGISIRWNSSRPDIIDEEGFVDALAIEKAIGIELTAYLEIEGVRRESQIEVIVSKPDGTEQYRELILEEIDRIAANISNSSDEKYVRLPQIDRSGFNIKWRHIRTNWDFIISLVALTAFMLTYLGKHKRLEKKIKKRKAEIEQDFPNFICKFVLLLNAGLVVTAAIDKIAEDYAASKSEPDRPLYEEILAINRKIKNSNASISTELRHFAERCGIHEIMSFAMIIHDNLNKGIRLEEKLEAEGTLLWNKHKKRAEELGRIADTKLSLPLMILLISLIMITTSPAIISL